MESKIKKERGFTLLELLVVIAIIGILVSLGIVSYSGAQKKARDAQRRADLKAVQDGLEQYYADNTAYPAGDCNPGTDYLPGGLPQDPRWGSYNYNECLTDLYEICADLEGEGTDNDGSEDDFCVQNLQ